MVIIKEYFINGNNNWFYNILNDLKENKIIFKLKFNYYIFFITLIN